MTELEAQDFIDNTIKGLWTEWKPTEAEYLLWSRKLQSYDFHKAKKALGDWVTEQDFHGKSPKIGKILKALSARKAAIKTKSSEPIKVFELFDQNNPNKKQSFFVGSERELKTRTAQSFEIESENKRISFNSLYGGDWIVVQNWLRYYE